MSKTNGASTLYGTYFSQKREKHLTNKHILEVEISAMKKNKAE